MEKRQYSVVVKYITSNGKPHYHRTSWYFTPNEAWKEAHEYENHNSHKWEECSFGVSSRKVY